MKIAVLVGSLFLVGCATTPFPYDTGPGAAAGTVIGGYVGYVSVSSLASSNPIVSVLGAVGGAFGGRSIGAIIDNEESKQ